MSKVRPRLVAAAVVVAAVSAVLASGADAPPGHFTANSGYVFDNKTKLSWQQPASTAGYTYAQAKAYCSQLVDNGGGWRLPTTKELLTIVDFSQSMPPLIDQNFFSGTSSVLTGNAWLTATVIAGVGPNNIGLVDFGAGWVYYNDVSGGGAFFVRCVR